MKFKLKTGQTVIVSDADAARVRQYSWHIGGDGYVTHLYRRPGEKRDASPHCFYLQNLITGLKMSRHINGNKLDNRRENLRPPTSIYPGIFWIAATQRWRVVVKRKDYGTFKTFRAALARRREVGPVEKRLATFV